MEKLKAGVLAARGEVGQRFVENLINHPYFEVHSLYGSERTVGVKYSEATGRTDLPDLISEVKMEDVNDGGWKDDDVVYSALPSSVARSIEGMIAKEKPVLSTASSYRMEEDTPIIVPGVNEDHVGIIEKQKSIRNWEGFVIPQSNCTTVGLVASLYPIYERYGNDLQEVIMVSEQAVSGAGYEAVETWRGQRVSQGVELPKAFTYDRKVDESLFEGNVIPYIRDEEEKVKSECLKILGRYDNSKKKIIDADFYLDCFCTRVPVLEGHTEAIFLKMGSDFEIEDLKDTWLSYKGEPQIRNLPSAPKAPIIVVDEPYRPQPRLDITREEGMAVIIGRAIKSSKNRFKYFVLSHNTKLGAAEGVILIGEYLHNIGMLHSN